LAPLAPFLVFLPFAVSCLVFPIISFIALSLASIPSTFATRHSKLNHSITQFLNLIHTLNAFNPRSLTPSLWTALDTLAPLPAACTACSVTRFVPHFGQW
jgi:hypothetical protein